jgi:hypothetical protein
MQGRSDGQFVAEYIKAGLSQEVHCMSGQLPEDVCQLQLKVLFTLEPCAIQEACKIHLTNSKLV